MFEGDSNKVEDIDAPFYLSPNERIFDMLVQDDPPSLPRQEQESLAQPQGEPVESPVAPQQPENTERDAVDPVGPLVQDEIKLTMKTISQEVLMVVKDLGVATDKEVIAELTQRVTKLVSSIKESNLTRRYYDIRNVMIEAGLISFKKGHLMMMHQTTGEMLSGTKVLRNKLIKQLREKEKTNRLKAERVRELRHFTSTFDRFKTHLLRQREEVRAPNCERLRFPLLFITCDDRNEAVVSLTPNSHFLKAHGRFESFKTELDIIPDFLSALEQQENRGNSPLE